MAGQVAIREINTNQGADLGSIPVREALVVVFVYFCCGRVFLFVFCCFLFYFFIYLLWGFFNENIDNINIY